MNEPAPQGLIHVDRELPRLHTGVAKDVERETGRPTTPQSLNPGDDSALGQIRDELGNFKRYAEADIKERIQGTSESGKSYTTSGGNKFHITTLLGRVGRKVFRR